MRLRWGEMKFDATGFAVGPVVRHAWMIPDEKIGIGPEISLRHTTATSAVVTTFPDTPRVSATENGPEHTARDVDHPLRMNFFFSSPAETMTDAKA